MTAARRPIRVTKTSPKKTLKKSSPRKSLKRGVDIDHDEHINKRIRTEVQPLYPHVGYAMTWGTGTMGQLGYSVESRKYPTCIPSFKNKRFIQAQCGAMQTIFLSDKGQVYTCGVGDDGATGRGGDQSSEDDDEEEDEPKGKSKKHSKGKDQKKSESDEDTDGDGDSDDDEYKQNTDVEKPKKIKGRLIRSLKIVQVGSGDSFSVLLDSNGVVYQTGTFRDSEGTYGITVRDQKPNRHVQKSDKWLKFAKILDLSDSSTFLNSEYSGHSHRIEQSDRIVKIIAGGNHVIALSENGKIYTWGTPEMGQLGRVSQRENRTRYHDSLKPGIVYLPSPYNNLSKYKCVDVAAGVAHSLVRMSDGSIFGWGSNTCGQLGVKGMEIKWGPVLVDFFGKLKQKNISVTGMDGGDGHSLFVTSDGNMYSTGRGDEGQLGAGKKHTRSYIVPSEIDRENGMVDSEVDSKILKVDLDPEKLAQDPHCKEKTLFAVKVFSAACVSYCTSANHVPYAWGFGDCGQLGNAMTAEAQAQKLRNKESVDVEDFFTPTLLKSKFTSDKKISMISAGAQHSALIAYE